MVYERISFHRDWYCLTADSGKGLRNSLLSRTELSGRSKGCFRKSSGKSAGLMLVIIGEAALLNREISRAGLGCQQKSIHFCMRDRRSPFSAATELD